MHGLSTLAWTGIFGVIVGVDATVLGSTHDRVRFNDSGPFRDTSLFFSPKQNVTGENFFTERRAHFIFPIKRGLGMT